MKREIKARISLPRNRPIAALIKLDRPKDARKAASRPFVVHSRLYYGRYYTRSGLLRV
jgi:hypothetical protein